MMGVSVSSSSLGSPVGYSSSLNPSSSSDTVSSKPEWVRRFVGGERFGSISIQAPHHMSVLGAPCARLVFAAAAGTVSTAIAKSHASAKDCMMSGSQASEALGLVGGGIGVGRVGFLSLCFLTNSLALSTVIPSCQRTLSPGSSC